jgi:hypothetical protein
MWNAYLHGFSPSENVEQMTMSHTNHLLSTDSTAKLCLQLKLSSLEKTLQMGRYNHNSKACMVYVDFNWKQKETMTTA